MKFAKSTTKKKSNDALDTSLGFDDLRKYLIFTISAWLSKVIPWGVQIETLQPPV